MRKFFFFLILLVSYLWKPAFAQLCTGSLGDPVAWIKFGEGSGPSPALPPSVTNYTYTGGCPNDGFYTITNLSFGCFGGSWHTLVGDHTPDDAGGKFMLVNASNTPGVFYLDTVRGLCENTTYEFSSYVMNVVKPIACNGNGIDPNLTFSIETTGGLVILTHNSGDISEKENPTWVQYGTFFKTPANVTAVVVRITNNAPGGCGNDLALDDITFRACGPSINATLAVNGQAFISLCEGDNRSYLLNATYSAGYANPQLQWQSSLDNGISWNNIPGATNATYLRPATNSGNYLYRLLIGDGPNINKPVCRIASGPITIQVSPPPFVQATNYVFSCYGSTVDLFAAGGSIYQWTGPNGFSSNLQAPSIKNIQFNQAGMYRVRVTTVFGCTNTDSTDIDVYPAVDLTVSPDADICEGQSVQLNAGGGTRYRWEPADGLSNPEIPNPIASPTDSIVYKLLVLNDYNCFDTASVKVNVWKRPGSNAGPDLRTITGYPVQLLGGASGTDIRYNWSPAQNMDFPGSLRPTVTLNGTSFPQSFTFRLDVSSNLGCGTSSDEMTVTVYETVKIPNTFTPNGDGFNDTWDIELLRIFSDAVVEVYNTSGNLVYKSIGYSLPWDGKRNGQSLPAGTYYYTIDLKVQNAKKLVGYVTIFK
jgi:gliding motility-associated-like protein